MSSSTFNFPFGIDIFEPTLINDITVVNALHVTDLRMSILELEKSLVGSTPFPYDNVNLIQDGYNIKTSLEVLDQNIYAVQQQLGFVFDGVDGYAARIDSIEFGLNSHRVENSSIDADGYSVHGVEGFVVGTENVQRLDNKVVDTGTDNALSGPKFIARATSADSGIDMIQVFDKDNNKVFYVNEDGDGYFARNITVEGDRIIRGTDVIESSLTVDGSTILGDNPSVDTTTINGNTTINGTVSISGDLTQSGQDVSLGDDTGTLDLDFAQIDISQDGYIRGNLVVDKSTTLGSTTGDNHLIKGSILHSFGVFHTAGSFRALGTKFRVEDDTTYIDTADLISSSSLTLPNVQIDTLGNIISDGYVFTFGNAANSATNTFLVNGTTSTNDLLVTQGIQVFTGSTTTPTLNTSDLNVTGPTQLNDGTQQVGYVLTAVDSLGNTEWKPPASLPWNSVITDGYVVTDAYGTTPLAPQGFYDASPNEEVFVQTDGYGSFTINLPSTTTIGTRIRFIDANGSWSSANRALVFPPAVGVVKTFSDTNVDIVQNWITITNHGLLTGQRGTLTGNIPGGLNYPFVYVIVQNTNQIQFAASVEDALNDIFIDITSTGSGTTTFTSGTIMGAGFLELDVPNGWVEVISNGTTWRAITS